VQTIEFMLMNLDVLPALRCASTSKIGRKQPTTADSAGSRVRLQPWALLRQSLVLSPGHWQTPPRAED
jgi:hypothetical protein